MAFITLITEIEADGTTLQHTLDSNQLVDYCTNMLKNRGLNVLTDSDVSALHFGEFVRFLERALARQGLKTSGDNINILTKALTEESVFSDDCLDALMIEAVAQFGGVLETACTCPHCECDLVDYGFYEYRPKLYYMGPDKKLYAQMAQEEVEWHCVNCNGQLDLEELGLEV